MDKVLNTTEYPEAWIRVTLYDYNNFWINTQTAQCYNEITESFLQGSLNQRGHLQYNLSREGRKRRFSAHQLVYYSFHNYTEVPQDLEIDHKDRNKKNNSVGNLHLVSFRQNQQNNGKRWSGVYFNKQKKKFHVSIRFKGNNCFLGYYDTEEEAGKAYEKAEQQINEGTFNPPDWITRKSTSKYPGVSLCKRTGKWRARFRNEVLGLFPTPELAYQAYCNKKGIECVL